MSCMERADPYPVIKNEIERELQHIGALQAQVFATHSVAAANQLKQQFQDVAEQLNALESAVKAMVANPAQYKLELRTAYARQVEVETLWFQLSDLQATSSQIPLTAAAAAAAGPQSGKSSRLLQEVELHARGQQQQQQQWHGPASTNSSRTTPLPPPPPAAARRPAPLRHSKLLPAQASKQQTTAAAAASGFTNGSMTGRQRSDQHRHPNGDSLPLQDKGIQSYNHVHEDEGWDMYGSVVQQQMQEQDQALEHISLHVDNIKQTGQQMYDELEEQALLLDNLQEDTDTTQLRLRGLRKKVTDVLKQARTDRQLCLILSLSVVLVVLTVMALA